MKDVWRFLDFSVFHTCQYSGLRLKRTMLAFNAVEFKMINRLCPGVSKTHRHAKWGIDAKTNKFATVSETAYPFVLAKRIASQFVVALHRLGIKTAPEILSEVSDTDSALLPTLRAEAGLQSKTSKLPPLIPTFAARIALTGFSSQLPAHDLHSKLHHDTTIASRFASTRLPKGSKLLDVIPPLLPAVSCYGGVVASSPKMDQAEKDHFTKQLTNETFDETPPGELQTQVWGVPWTEQQFVEQMVQFGHPCTMDTHLPAVLKDTIEKYYGMSESDRIQHRTKRIGFWIKRLKDLRADEQQLKESLEPDVAKVLKGKNLLVWKEMLQATGYHDPSVFDEMALGTDLVGDVAPTGLWPKKFQPASITVSELEDVAVRERQSIESGLFRCAFEDELEHEVWKQTLEEVSCGQLEGPINISELPPNYTLSRRFAIHQGVKTRCIDDFSMSSVNRCVQTTESPKPHTADTLAALCTSLMKYAKSKPDVKWLGRPFDLKGAYRQCAIKPTSTQFAHIFVRRPSDKKLVAFRMLALPFGAVRSVHAFLRMAHSLWFLLVKEFLVLTTNYFDDYVVLGSHGEASNLTGCVQLFLRVLGWKFAESGSKAPDFSSAFQALGITVDICKLGENLVLFDNTAARCAEIIGFLDTILATRKLTQNDALKLRGRLQFTSGQIFGRVVKAALSAITWHAYQARCDSVSDETAFCLRLHRKFLSQGKPRRLRHLGDKPFFVQTDACCEWRQGNMFAAIGAVLFDSSGNVISYFSAELDQQLLAALNPSRKQTIIFECEFFALFCALHAWADVAGPAIVIYTDNNAVRDSMISCNTGNEVAKKILVATLVSEMQAQLTPWYSRVPTDSNCADAPSRLDITSLQSVCAKPTECNPNKMWSHVLALYEKWGDEQAASCPH